MSNPTHFRWQNPYILVQLLGLAPLLVLSDTLLKASLLGAGNFLLLGAAVAATGLAAPLANPLRLALGASILGSLSVCLSLGLAFANLKLQQALALAAPLLLANALLVSQLAHVAPPPKLALNGRYALALAAKFWLVLLLVSAVRQFASQQLILHWPFAAFFVAAFLLAVKNYRRSAMRRGQPNQAPNVAPQSTGQKRVRPTGKIH